MTQQPDTLLKNTLPTAASEQPMGSQSGQLTPKMVLSWLPKDATPAQQDSAIQHHIKPAEIHWSSQPDTLHLPGYPKPVKFGEDIHFLHKYSESFFAKDSLYHPELPWGRQGVAGTPIPYTIASDNFFVSILLGCFILIVMAFSQSRSFILRQAKNFFYVVKGSTTTITETSTEIRFQMVSVLQTALMLALSYFFYTRTHIGETFMVDTYQVIAIYLGVFVAYFAIKSILYAAVNWVFFDKKKNGQWQKSFLFVSAMEGVVLFPMIMLQTFFELPLQTTPYFTLFVVILARLLALFKAHIVFFKDRQFYLQIILYFCGLELIPLLALWGVLATINSYLKIIF